MFIENEGEAEVIETEVSEDSSTTHEETNTEAEGETSSQDEKPERRTETPEQKRARLKRQLEQLEKKHGFKDEGDADKGSQKSETKEVGGDERYDRLELKTEGIKDKAEQDIVLDYMRYKKLDVMSALNSAAVKAELREYRERSSTPAPSTRTATPAKGVEYWARQVEAGKPNSDDPKMRAQVREYLKKKLT